MAFVGGKSGVQSDAEAASGLLRDYVSAETDAEASRLLERLFDDYIHPWCEDAARRTLRTYGLHGANQSDEQAEVAAEVMLQMAGRLREIRTGHATVIANLRGYVVSAVYNSCFGRIRGRCPQHAQLQNRIRYLLRNDQTFAVWTSVHGESLAGLRRWVGNENHVPAPVMQRSGETLRELLSGLFGTAGAPVRLTDLIVSAAESLGIADSPQTTFGETEHAASDPAADHVMMERQSLENLWGEVIQLPPSQRLALLLNLRDGGGNGVIELIPATGIATFDQLAAALNLSSLKLAAVWADLPMDDAGIAGMLGVTRQQVINLRKSARDRLARRRKKNDSNTRPEPSSGLRTGSSMRSRIRALFQGQK